MIFEIQDVDVIDQNYQKRHQHFVSNMAGLAIPAMNHKLCYGFFIDVADDVGNKMYGNFTNVNERFNEGS